MLAAINDHLMALISVKATYVPETSIDAQVMKSLSKKRRFVDRPHPNAIQLLTAFMRIVSFKQGNGDKKPTSSLAGHHIFHRRFSLHPLPTISSPHSFLHTPFALVGQA